MPRLFVAIELPERVRERLALLRQPLPGARWAEAENLHITLRFAGDVDNHVADEIAGFLAEIDADPFELQISDLGTFGTREPRSLWAGVLPSEPLAMLQRATERACRSAGGRAPGSPDESWQDQITIVHRDRSKGCFADRESRRAWRSSAERERSRFTGAQNAMCDPRE